MVTRKRRSRTARVIEAAPSRSVHAWFRFPSYVRRLAAAELAAPLRIIEEEIAAFTLAKSPYRYTVLHQLWLTTALFLVTPAEILLAIGLYSVNGAWFRIPVPDWFVVAQMSPLALALITTGYYWFRKTSSGERPLPYFDESEFPTGELVTRRRWDRAVMAANVFLLLWWFFKRALS